MSIFQLVCVFVCLFIINLKYLIKTIDLLSLYMWAWIQGSKCLEIFPKNQGGDICVRLQFKTASSAAVSTCLFYWTCVKYVSSVKCLLSVCSAISLFSCLDVNNCIEILLDFLAFLHVARSFLYQSDCMTFQTSLLKKQAILNLYLEITITQWLDILGAN